MKRGTVVNLQGPVINEKGQVDLSRTSNAKRANYKKKKSEKEFMQKQAVQMLDFEKKGGHRVLDEINKKKIKVT